jgi:hypothetical protein
MQSPAISISPGVVGVGTSPIRLSVTSSEGFNLSNVDPAQVAISPATGISNLAVSKRSERSLALFCDLASDAPAGNRDLTISVNDVSAAAQFKVIRISISPNTIIMPIPPTSRTAVLTVSSEGGFDLSNVGAGQVRIRPDTDIHNITVTNATPNRLTLSLLFILANDNDIAGIDRVLTIMANDVSASAKFRTLPT